MRLETQEWNHYVHGWIQIPLWKNYGFTVCLLFSNNLFWFFLMKKGNEIGNEGVIELSKVLQHHSSLENIYLHCKFWNQWNCHKVTH